MAHKVTPVEWGVETAFVVSGTKYVKAAGKTGGKLLGKAVEKFSQKMGKSGKAGKSQTIEALDLITAQGIPNAGGSIVSFLTKQEEVYYRVYSGENASGRFLTKARPKNAVLAQEGLALPPSNTAEYIQEVIVPAGVRLQRSRALPVPDFGKKRGGMEQFQIYQIFFNGVMFCILFYPGSDNRKWGQFLNLWGVSTEGEVIWKAALPDNTPGCFDRINLLEGELHAYASTFDCILDPTNGKIISSEFYK